MKPGYKQSEVGVIPEDWEVTNLGAVAGLEVGYAFRSTWFQKHDGVPLLRGENVGYGRPDWSDTRRLAARHAASFAAYRLQPGDVIIGMDRTFTKSGSKISVLKDADCPCLLVQRVGRFVPKKCDGRFLWAVLSSARFQQSLLAEQKGMDIPHLSRVEILHPVVPLPPTKAERDAIAWVLSDADALIESCEQLLAKKRQLKQGAMQELLTGKKRLPGFSGEWEVKRLGEIAEIVMGQSPRSLNYNAKELGLPLIQGNADIANRKTIRRIFTTESTKRGNRGDVLMSVRAPAGEISRAMFDVCLGRGVCAIRYTNDFMYHYLISQEPSWAKLSKGSTFDSVNSADVKALDVRLPTDTHEQTAIAAILSDMDAETAALEARLAKARSLKQGMMQQLLTGRIRLV